jgi:hypothetical protein
LATASVTEALISIEPAAVSGLRASRSARSSLMRAVTISSSMPLDTTFGLGDLLAQPQTEVTVGALLLALGQGGGRD